MRQQYSRGASGFFAPVFQRHVPYFISVRRQLRWWQEQLPDPWVAGAVVSMCSEESNLAQKRALTFVPASGR